MAAREPHIAVPDSSPVRGGRSVNTSEFDETVTIDPHQIVIVFVAEVLEYQLDLNKRSRNDLMLSVSVAQVRRTLPTAWAWRPPSPTRASQ